ncbi:MAG: DNA-3-methyladenine glycosylase [Candidatus Zixiibacteriota bacterium]
MGERLNRSFYLQPTLEVAKQMLGKFLVREIGKERLVGKIVETEAYIGPFDLASHAYGGKKTERNKAEFFEGGHIYIYLVYGMYWQFNISTSASGKPECVLLRALEPIEGIEIMRRNRNSSLQNLTNGPGKLCQAFALDKGYYGEDLVKSSRIWLEDRGFIVDESEIGCGPRIGIDYAGEWAKKPWRFYIKDNPFVSRRR